MTKSMVEVVNGVSINPFCVGEQRKPIVKEVKDVNPLDIQIGGTHYKGLDEYQPWLVYKAWLTPEEFKGYMKAEAINYLQREMRKGGREDIEKACHVLQAYLEMTKGEFPK